MNLRAGYFKSFAAGAAILAIACAASPAQAQRTKRVDGNTYYRAPHHMGGKSIIIPVGTTFEGRMSTTISSAKSHPGLAFSIVMSSPVLANGTDVVIPSGSEIMGEVVEAIPSSSLPRRKKEPPPRGKLRVQLSGLRTPDGTTYPMVAALIGEEGGRSGRDVPLGTGVAYMGSAAAFEAVSPGMQKAGRSSGRRGPELVSKREALKHEIYGLGDDRYGRAHDEDRIVRSLVVRKHDYWIDAGSPLSVRLNAPLKLAVSAPGQGVPLGSVQEEPDEELPAPSPRKTKAEPPAFEPGQTAPAPAAPAPPAPPSSPSADF